MQTSCGRLNADMDLWREMKCRLVRRWWYWPTVTACFLQPDLWPLWPWQEICCGLHKMDGLNERGLIQPSWSSIHSVLSGSLIKICSTNQWHLILFWKAAGVSFMVSSFPHTLPCRLRSKCTFYSLLFSSFLRLQHRSLLFCQPQVQHQQVLWMLLWESQLHK